MRITETDKNLFKALGKSQLGKDLIDYCDRLCDDLCDARNWSKDDTKESVTRAAKYIQEHIRSKVRGDKASSVVINESE